MWRLRKLTATPPLLLHASMESTGKTSHFPNITTQTDSKYSNQGEWDGYHIQQRYKVYKTCSLINLKGGIPLGRLMQRWEY
jgi:hypothetical protein